MKRQFLTLAILCLLFSGCSSRSAFGEENPALIIKRFDTQLFRYLNKQLPEDSLTGNYKDFLNLFGEQVIRIGKTDSAGFYERLNSAFSEPALMTLYRDEQQKFPDLEAFNSELNPAFVQLLKEFPELKQPAIYMHVSGLNQNVIVTDDILSLSADKYMGADYPFYQNYFYDYQLQNMTPERIIPDYLLGFMMANMPFEGNRDVLLERMLYEGKLRYILSRLLPDRQVWEYVAYTKEQYLWCSNNQSRIWKTILQNDHLYTSDHIIVTQYLNDAPHTAFLLSESPGRVGTWVGYQIIMSYMQKYPETSLHELMSLTDAQELLKQSKYKP